MPGYSTNAALPVEQLSLVVVEGEGQMGELIGEKILGPLPINNRNAHYMKAALADSLGLRQISSDKYIHAPAAEFPRLSATFGDGTLTVTPRGVEIAIPNEMVLDYNGVIKFDVLAFFCQRFGKEISGLTKEILIAAQIFSTGNFGSATNSTVAYTVALSATNSFIADMIASARRLKAKGEAPPYISVMSGTTFERVRQAATVISYAAGTLKAGQEATKGTILEALREFGFVDLLIGDAYYNAAADQASLASTTLTPVWNTTYIWNGKAGMTTKGGDSGGAGVPILSGVGANVFWESYMPGGVQSADKDSLTFEGGNYVEVYPALNADAQILRVKMSHKPQITNARGGDLVATQLS